MLLRRLSYVALALALSLGTALYSTSGRGQRAELFALLASCLLASVAYATRARSDRWPASHTRPTQ